MKHFRRFIFGAVFKIHALVMSECPEGGTQLHLPRVLICSHSFQTSRLQERNHASRGLFRNCSWDYHLWRGVRGKKAELRRQEIAVGLGYCLQKPEYTFQEVQKFEYALELF